MANIFGRIADRIVAAFRGRKGMDKTIPQPKIIQMVDKKPTESKWQKVAREVMTQKDREFWLRVYHRGGTYNRTNRLGKLLFQ